MANTIDIASIHSLQPDTCTIQDSTVAGSVAAVYCQYRSKRCWHLRALKQNGALHKLCEFHRDRANVNQRRLEQRRRASRGAEPMAHGFINSKHIEYDAALQQEILATAPMVAPMCSPFNFMMTPAAMTFFWPEFAENANLDSDARCIVAATGELSPTLSDASPLNVNMILSNFEIDDEPLELQEFVD